MGWKAGTCVAAAVLVLASACSDPTPPQVTATPDRSRAGAQIATPALVKKDHDAFGIRNIEPTLLGGTVWTANWWGTRSFDEVDPKDPWFDADHGSATYRVDDGKLFISGDIPRMYVYDPAGKRQWRDVEATMYFKRVADTNIPYAGMTIVARSNHLDTESGRYECDTRGYGARMRYDGAVDFEKETAFPLNDAVGNESYWSGDLPKDRWIGVKFIVYDAADGVHLELWSDLSDGKDGGHWKQINEVVDDGNLFGTEPCDRGIDPRMPLTNDPSRTGSESGKPNLTVYFRSDGVRKDGLVYKWGSIREIRARQPAAKPSD